MQFQANKSTWSIKENYLQVINEFAVTISSLNTVDQLLWAIAKHVISRLDFEDCVIYIIDPKEHILVQLAAYGPKNPADYEILEPITIPMGKGIVGTVAATGKPELIQNTLDDPRYIVDDEVRLSELAVPIIFENKVLGVIDSEHPQEDFYDQFHLDILTTLAAMVAPRIAFIQATDKVLLEKNQELNKMVQDLEQVQQELIEAKNIAEETSQGKTKFIYQMSHELRTPLNAIIGYTEMIIEDLAKTNSPNSILLGDLNRIEFSGKHLLQVINNILDISKIEANEMPVLYQPESINALVLEAIIAVEPSIKWNRNELLFDKLENDLFIYTDSQKLKQILINLLGNAGKFTNNGLIELSVDISKVSQETCVIFEVRDTGPGIKESFLPHLFKPFHQDEFTKNRGGVRVGSGLGLAISEHLAQLLGGEIKVKSKLGEGSTFSLILPIEIAN